jgi:hypothetical protein
VPSRASDASRDEIIARPRRVEHPLAAAAHDAGLGADHHVVSNAELRQQSAEHLFGGPVAIPGGRVDQGAARLAERHELIARLVLVGVSTPRHGTEPEARHLQPGVADRPLLHGCARYRRAGRPNRPLPRRPKRIRGYGTRRYDAALCLARRRAVTTRDAACFT